ncbi:tRNA 2-thiouridine synthesizing protein C [Phocoenobacter uteri]|uniref:tRNA 2-thiouridine synthesizing protein C n=1 Tax=Phocoenobacter uteri TaxID=146806 RepID=A0A379CBJ8_9PAST|nr:sulfurtransferase complex subunit TusC [Phocoenobacter uteri]MDG6881489.1 sulfurtransferase [Phocoenobacter uteri]SUB59519.1 tRNA 2-thiouridine synthesizing protein C [Phocoenobacter uteri]
MKKYKLAVLFTQPPFDSAISREGLDALLAASVFCDEDEIAICFLNDGVFNLLKDQHPDLILQKDHSVTFKLIDLYELSECFICQQSLQQRNISADNLLISGYQCVSQQTIFDILQQSQKVLTF